MSTLIKLMAITDEFPKIVAAINKGLSDTYGTTTFNEDPREDETSAIGIFKRWVPVATDETHIWGELWIMRGCTDLLEAQSQNLILSRQVNAAERAIRQELMTNVQRSLSPYFFIIQDKNNEFLPGWDTGLKIRSEKSKQQSPFMVQLLVPFRLSLALRNVY